MHDDLTPEIINQAREEFAAELHLERVRKEVARLRAEHGKSWWQRFLAALPFTIAWRTK